MNASFPVSRSILSAQALADHLLPVYRIGEIASCRLYSPGINDTYQVCTRAGEVFFLRVYRTPWRSCEDVGYEIDALNHLYDKGIPAAHPVADRSGVTIQTLTAPEGQRCAVLFTRAPGEEPDYEEDAESKAYHYGRAVARLHNGLDGFFSPRIRAKLDVDFLIKTPLETVLPLLDNRPQDRVYFEQFVAALLRKVDALPVRELEWGFCHGDLQGYHHHISEDGAFTFFDFDCCGYGIRAYDLAVFRWCARLSDKEGIWWGPYLQGYQEERKLNDVDVRAIPLFVGARYLWHLWLHILNAPDWGYGWLNNHYFDRAMKNLRAVEKDYF